MGTQIEAGEQGIYFSDGSWLVFDWCMRAAEAAGMPYRPPENSEDWRTLDTVYVSAEAVTVADRAIPRDYAAAKAGGWLEGRFRYRDRIDEGAFVQCREFLAYAAAGGFIISGG